MVRKHYTPERANRSLPLVKAITADVQATARAIQQTSSRMRDAGHLHEGRTDGRVHAR